MTSSGRSLNRQDRGVKHTKATMNTSTNITEREDSGIEKLEENDKEQSNRVEEMKEVKKEKEETETYRTLVLSGGSIKCIATLGSIQYGYDNLLLQRVDTFIGTSAGAILCYLLCIGYTPIEIIMYLCGHAVFSRPHHIDIVSMMNGTGALEFSLLSTHIERMTIEKIGRLVTFQDVWNLFGKKLVMNTYNLSKDRIEYLSIDTTPDMPCLTALRQTCSLPFVFEAYKYMGDYYVDGGIYENFAIAHRIDRDDGKRLGICIDIVQVDPSTNNMMEYVYHLLTIPIRQNLQHLKQSLSTLEVDVIHIHPTIGSMFQLQLSSHDLLELFSSGYQQAKLFFQVEST